MKDKLEEVLHRYADLFPPELPFVVPPDRGINDVHRIVLVDGARPVAKSPYK